MELIIIKKYETRYIIGERNRKGKEYNIICDIIFKGQYLNGKKWNCKMFDNNNKLIFELKNGKGFGQECSFDCEDKYIGEYLNGKRHGKWKDYCKVGDDPYDYNINLWFDII